MNQIARPAVLSHNGRGVEQQLPASSSLYRLTVGQYHRMVESGVLASGARVELLEGLLVNKMTLHPPHVTAVTRLSRFFARTLPEDEWTVRVQAPITLKASEPEPDVVIARGPDSTYRSRHPVPREVALAIEVGDSTVLDDRRYKGALYARARIAHFWLVNLVGGVVEVYASPRAGKSPSFQDRVDFGKGQTIPLPFGDGGFPGLDVAALLA